MVLIDDLDHMRGVVGTDQTKVGDIRRMSGILRRLLVNREIAKIATPRIGKIEFSAPDNTPFYRAERKIPFVFFLSGRARVFGWSQALWAFEAPSNLTSNDIIKKSQEIIGGHEYTDTVSLRLENFLNQRVLCYRGKWASREQIIKYVANVASGVHTTAPKNEHEILLAKIRSANRIVFKDGGVHVELLGYGLHWDETRFDYKPGSIDPVLIELLAAAKFLCESPMVVDLERIIREEVGH